MREIKFRTWDENSQELIYEIGITPEGIPYLIPDYAEASDQFNYYPSCHKMQYTGLKDKNCKEIFEGDIIRYKQRNLGKTFGINDGKDYDIKTREIVYMDQGFNVPQGFIKDLEVIGNIYER